MKNVALAWCRASKSSRRGVHCGCGPSSNVNATAGTSVSTCVITPRRRSIGPSERLSMREIFRVIRRRSAGAFELGSFGTITSRCPVQPLDCHPPRRAAGSAKQRAGAEVPARPPRCPPSCGVAPKGRDSVSARDPTQNRSHPTDVAGRACATPSCRLRAPSRCLATARLLRTGHATRCATNGPWALRIRAWHWSDGERCEPTPDASGSLPTLFSRSRQLRQSTCIAVSITSLSSKGTRTSSELNMLARSTLSNTMVRWHTSSFHRSQLCRRVRIGPVVVERVVVDRERRSALETRVRSNLPGRWVCFAICICPSVGHCRWSRARCVTQHLAQPPVRRSQRIVGSKSRCRLNHRNHASNVSPEQFVPPVTRQHDLELARGKSGNE